MLRSLYVNSRLLPQLLTGFTDFNYSETVLKITSLFWSELNQVFHLLESSKHSFFFLFHTDRSPPHSGVESSHFSNQVWMSAQNVDLWHPRIVILEQQTARCWGSRSVHSLYNGVYTHSLWTCPLQNTSENDSTGIDFWWFCWFHISFLCDMCTSWPSVRSFWRNPARRRKRGKQRVSMILNLRIIQDSRWEGSKPLPDKLRWNHTDD